MREIENDSSICLDTWGSSWDKKTEIYKEQKRIILLPVWIPGGHLGIKRQRDIERKR